MQPPNNLRHKINFSVIKDIYDPIIGTPLNITKSLPELAGKKITLSYAPATPEDEGIINSYLPEPHEDGSPITPEEIPSSLPAYLIRVKPELKIDGEVVTTGSAVGLGMTEDFKMTFSGPGLNANDVIKNDVQAGEFYGIALNLGRISQEQMQELKTELETTKTKLETKDFTGLTKDDVLGDLLYSTALSYHAEFDVMDHVQAKTMGLTAIRFPSEAHFSTELSVYSIFGTPISVSANGMAMDVDRIMTMVKSLDGDLEKPIQFYLSSGANGSALEHSVPEQLFSTAENPAEGISAVKALQIATDQGIPIYTINQSNIETIVPQLQVDSDTIIDIQNAVNAGMEVTVQQSDITYNGWTGHGYIVINPTTGAGAYMIAGGMSGAIIFVFLLLMSPVFLINVLFIALILDNSEIILDSLKKIFGTVVETINIYSCFPNPMLMFIPNLYCLSHYGEDAVKQYYECLNDIFMDFLAAEVIQETTLLTLIAYLGLEIGTKVAKKIFFIWELYSTPQDIYAFGKCNYDLTTGN